VSVSERVKGIGAEPPHAAVAPRAAAHTMALARLEITRR
jgi:hypothetical protein